MDSKERYQGVQNQLSSQRRTKRRVVRKRPVSIGRDLLMIALTGALLFASAKELGHAIDHQYGMIQEQVPNGGILIMKAGEVRNNYDDLTSLAAQYGKGYLITSTTERFEGLERVVERAGNPSDEDTEAIGTDLDQLNIEIYDKQLEVYGHMSTNIIEGSAESNRINEEIKAIKEKRAAFMTKLAFEQAQREESKGKGR